MKRLILVSLVLATSIPPLYAQGTILHTDRSGYMTGIDGNRTVNTYTDRYGNTTGWVGGKYISTYSDGSGGTTGTIGNKPISTYGDGYGYTRGTIGRDQVNTFRRENGPGIVGTCRAFVLFCREQGTIKATSSIAPPLAMSLRPTPSGARPDALWCANRS